MRVDGRYDISEAAIVRFNASRSSLLTEVPLPGEARRASDFTQEDVLEELEAMAMAMDPIVATAAAVVTLAA